MSKYGDVFFWLNCKLSDGGGIMSDVNTGDVCSSKTNEMDIMTGFYTHDETFHRIKQYLKGQGAEGVHALIAVDIKNLNSVNNLIGHEKGDEVVANSARIIRSVMGREDILGRIGGDEFLIFAKNCDKESAERLAALLTEKLSISYTNWKTKVDVEVAVGASIYSIDGNDVGDLYLKADSALYYAKKCKDRKYALYGKQISAEYIRAEEKQSLIQLRTLLEYMDGGVIMVEVSDDLNIYYASPSFYKMSHRAKSDIGENGELLLSVVVPEDKHLLSDMAHRIAQTGETLDCVYRVYETNGDVGWRQMRAARLPGLTVSGNRSIICVITNVTELKASNSTLEAVVDNTPDGIGIFEIDRDYVRPTFYNPTLENLINTIACSESAGGELHNVMTQSVFTGLLESTKESRDYEQEIKVFDNSGNLKCYNARGVNLQEHNGKKYSLVIFTDITKEYNLRKQIRFEQERYRTAVELTRAVLWEVDIEKKITYHYTNSAETSRTEAAVYRNSPEAIIESGIIHPDFVEDYCQMYEDLYNGDDSGEYFYKRLDDNNEYVWVKAKFRLLKDENGKNYYSVGIAEKVLNIDAQMRRFEQEQYFCEQVANSVFGSIKINISKNAIEKHYIASTTRRILSNSHSYEDLLRRSVPLISIKDDIDNLMQKLSRENLFEVFRNGQDWLNVEFRRQDEAGKIRWTSIALSLLRHPVSGDLYAFAYIRDVDKRRRWELSLPSKVERDAISMVYSRSTAFDMINTILPTVKDKSSYCAMCMIELEGLDAVMADKGEYMVQNILFTMGRVLRIIVDGAAIVGQVNADRIIIFRVGIGSPEEQFLRAEYAMDRLCTMLRITFPNEKLEAYSATVLARVSGASLHDMYEAAYSACTDSVIRNSKVVRVVLEDKEKSENIPEKPAKEETQYRDQQTGLLTRQDYYDIFRKLKPETLSSLGVFIADINGLRTINHRYGMEYGDNIIKNVAMNLREKFGDDEVFRVSGDEFMVLCRNTTQDSFIRRCDAVVELIGRSYTNIISVGSTWDSHVSDIQRLVDHAEELMKSAKQEYYRENNAVPTGSDYKTYMWVMDAIKEERFYVYLQPKAELKSGRITSCEALVRYMDADNGLVPPAKFIAVLERENVIKQLDFYVLNKTLDIIESWIRSGYQPVAVSVNFSRRTILAPNALNEVLANVKGREHLLKYLCIEITETIGSMERATITRVCETFQKAGFKLALDDFGSEYSNLYIVSALRFDEIKIDKSVIDDIVTNDLARLTVENTKRICERTGAILVAEGVESEEQMNVLKAIGCHMVQGYHINKPLPFKEFTEKYIVKNPAQ